MGPLPGADVEMVAHDHDFHPAASPESYAGTASMSKAAAISARV
jgi:hypothetical protein